MNVTHFVMFSFFNGASPFVIPPSPNTFSGYLSILMYPFFTGLGGDVTPTPPLNPSGGDWIVIYGRRRMRR